MTQPQGMAKACPVTTSPPRATKRQATVRKMIWRKKMARMCTQSMTRKARNMTMIMRTTKKATLWKLTLKDHQGKRAHENRR